MLDRKNLEPVYIIILQNTSTEMQQGMLFGIPLKKYQKGSWQIPVSIGTGKSVTPKLMSKKTSSFSLGKELFPVVNSSKKGFLRVKFDEELLSMLKQLFDTLGWDAKKDEKHTDTLLRGMVLTVLGKLDDQEILEEAQLRFDAHLKKQETIKPDLLEVIFSLAAWNGDDSTFEKLIQIYRKSSSQEAKLRVLTAMCYFKDEKLLLKTLKFILGKEVRSQNLALPIIRIAGNPYGKKIMWSWLKINWKFLSKKFGQGNPIANRIVASISLFADETMQNEIKNFFKKNPTPGTEMTLAQTLERIRINSKFLRQIKNEFTKL